MHTILQTACAAALPDASDVRVSQPVFLTAGWESDIFTFDLDYALLGAARREAQVMRLYSGAGAAEKAAHEFGVLRGLHAAGYPAPRPMLWHAGGAEEAAPFLIMEHVQGEVMWPLMAAANNERRAELIDLFCQLAARLHRLDARAVAGDAAAGNADPHRFADEMLAGARDLLGHHGSVGLLPLLDWLVARRDLMACRRPSVLHWDYHPGNVIVKDDGSAVVIDWTGGRVSDARFDLGWSLLLAYAYAGPALRDALRSSYEHHWGASIERLELFEVFAGARRLFDVGVSLSAGAEARGMRAGAAEQMRQDRQAIERVYGLVKTITGLRLPVVEDMLAGL